MFRKSYTKASIKDKVSQLFYKFITKFKSKTDDAINDTCGSLDTDITICKQLYENLRRVEAFLDDVTKKRDTHASLYWSDCLHETSHQS